MKQINEQVMHLLEGSTKPVNYHFGGTKSNCGNSQTINGHVFIDHKLELNGNISISDYSHFPIKGKVTIEDQLLKMSFVQKSPNDLILPVYYHLARSLEGSLEGKYTGIYTYDSEFETPFEWDGKKIIVSLPKGVAEKYQTVHLGFKKIKSSNF